VAVRFQASAGLGDLTAQFLLQLARNVDHYSPAEAARLSTAALEVLATRLARELDLHDWGTPEARRHALLTTVQAFIQRHLGEEALTNVLKHAGKPRTTVRLDYRETELVVEVADDGRPIPAAGPAATTVPGSGRGLLGLRERVALYGGELDAGPRPGGGWLVRARLPVDPPAGTGAGEQPAGLASPTAGNR
jgi:signal transduction histidine kinase